MLRDRADRAGAEALKMTPRVGESLACFTQRLRTLDVTLENQRTQGAKLMARECLFNGTPQCDRRFVAAINRAQYESERKTRQFFGFSRAMEQKSNGPFGLFGTTNC